MQKEGFVTIYIPESLISDIRKLNGPILLYMNQLNVEDGFALAGNEFVTSVPAFTEACGIAGMPVSALAIINKPD